MRRVNGYSLHLSPFVSLISRCFGAVCALTARKGIIINNIFNGSVMQVTLSRQRKLYILSGKG